MASIKVALESGVFPDSGRTLKRRWAGTFTNSQGVRKAEIGLNLRGHWGTCITHSEGGLWKDSQWG